MAFANRFNILSPNIINDTRFFFFECYLMFSLFILFILLWKFFEVVVAAPVGFVGGEAGSSYDLNRVAVVLQSSFSFSFVSLVLFLVSSHFNSMLLIEQNKLILNTMNFLCTGTIFTCFRSLRNSPDVFHNFKEAVCRARNPHLVEKCIVSKCRESCLYISFSYNLEKF